MRRRHSIGAMLVLLASPLASAQEGGAFLRWRDGSRIGGELRPSPAGELRWSSPLFATELVLDPEVLESVEFAAAEDDLRAPKSSGAFRVSTTAGDVFTADLVGSDQATLWFSSDRFESLPKGPRSEKMCGERSSPSAMRAAECSGTAPRSCPSSFRRPAQPR